MLCSESKCQGRHLPSAGRIEGLPDTRSIMYFLGFAQRSERQLLLCVRRVKTNKPLYGFSLLVLFTRAHIRQTRFLVYLKLGGDRLIGICGDLTLSEASLKADRLENRLGSGDFEYFDSSDLIPEHLGLSLSVLQNRHSASGSRLVLLNLVMPLLVWCRKLLCPVMNETSLPMVILSFIFRIFAIALSGASNQSFVSR